MMTQEEIQRLTDELKRRLVAFGGIQTLRDADALVKELVPFIVEKCDTEYDKGWDNHGTEEDWGDE